MKGLLQRIFGVKEKTVRPKYGPGVVIFPRRGELSVFTCEAIRVLNNTTKKWSDWYSLPTSLTPDDWKRLQGIVGPGDKVIDFQID